MTQRTPRDLVSRELTARPVYRPPSLLPDPTPRPGVVFRWIATHILGAANPTNVSQKLREGWVPVRAEDHPELQLLANKSGNVEIGGLMLCSMAAEMAKARDEYYAQQAANQMQSVDNNFLRENDARMPLFSERKTSTTRGGSFGSGN
jgi:hypothetical protein